MQNKRVASTFVTDNLTIEQITFSSSNSFNSFVNWYFSFTSFISLYNIIILDVREIYVYVYVYIYL